MKIFIYLTTGTYAVDVGKTMDYDLKDNQLINVYVIILLNLKGDPFPRCWKQADIISHQSKQFIKSNGIISQVCS